MALQVYISCCQGKIKRMEYSIPLQHRDDNGTSLIFKVRLHVLFFKWNFNANSVGNVFMSTETLQKNTCKVHHGTMDVNGISVECFYWDGIECSWPLHFEYKLYSILINWLCLAIWEIYSSHLCMFLLGEKNKVLIKLCITCFLQTGNGN